jgi:hypothetical protein
MCLVEEKKAMKWPNKEKTVHPFYPTLGAALYFVPITNAKMIFLM